MLEILGTIAGNILSLPGILGFALGMMTRRFPLGVALGILVGIGKTYVFAGMSFAGIEMVELVVAMGVGAVFGGMGTLVRRQGATV
ncbi:MAG: hypothetical protein ACK5JR_12995 [Tropicimonas sp.]|uniref:hypothetical protein n=1 Tax=Tropicimonas sp. TaxID=2067044 RepID=UPI003A841BF3